MLAGVRIDDGEGGFYDLGSHTYVWTSSEFDAASANYQLLYGANGNVELNNSVKVHGFSVRCLED